MKRGFRAIEPGQAGIPVPVPVAGLLAEGQIDLQTERSVSKSLVGIPRGEDRTEARRERGFTRPLHHRLIPVVEQRVSESTVSVVVQKGRRIRKLVHLGTHRPFLRERRGPHPVEPGDAEDVLEDTDLLIECLLDEKRVVGDFERFRSGLRRLCEECLRREQKHEHRPQRVNHDLRRGPGTDGDMAIVTPAKLHAVAFLAALLDLHDIPRAQLVRFRKLQKSRILIAHTSDRHRRAERARQQGVVLLDGKSAI